MLGNMLHCVQSSGPNVAANHLSPQKPLQLGNFIFGLTVFVVPGFAHWTSLEASGRPRLDSACAESVLNHCGWYFSDPETVFKGS
jgi:hypothetical protein